MIFKDFDEMSSNILYNLCYKEHAIVFNEVLQTRQQKSTTYFKLTVKKLSLKLIKINNQH